MKARSNKLYYWLLPSISVHINLQYARGNNATFNEAMLHTFGILTELKAEIKKSCVISSETLLSRGLFSALLLQETVKRSTVGYKKPFCCDVIPITSSCNSFLSIRISILIIILEIFSHAEVVKPYFTVGSIWSRLLGVTSCPMSSKTCHKKKLNV